MKLFVHLHSPLDIRTGNIPVKSKGECFIMTNLENLINTNKPVICNKCEGCDCSIRYGRYCPKCVNKLVGGLKAAFNESEGERPKHVTGEKTDMKGKMHFFNYVK